MSIHTIQLQPFSLAGAGTSIGATSIILTSFTKIDGSLVTMIDFGTVGYGTLEPSTAIQEEQISFSGVTQNINGTATLTGVKTVLMYSPYTETAGLTKSHAGGTVFIVSDNPGLWNTFTNKQNNETVTGTWIMSGGISSIGGGATTFASFPISPSSAPTTNYQLANKKYVDDTVVYGAPDASTTTKGIAKLSYAPIAPTNPIAFGSNDPAVVVITGVQSIAGVKTFTDSPVISKTTHSYLTINPTGASQEAGVILQKNGTAVWTIKKTTTDTLSVYNTTGPIDALEFADTTGIATFGAIPVLPATYPTTANQVTRKAYVDNYQNGIVTYAGDTASGTQNITHSLGYIPTYVRISCMKVIGYGARCIGTYNGTTTSCIYETHGSGWNLVGNNSTNMICISDDGTLAKNQVATVTVDATKIILAWTKTSTPSSADINILWEVR